MRVAILGPLCRDTIHIDGLAHDQLGGVTYYTGQALKSLGADVTIIASFGNEPENFLIPLEGIPVKHVLAAGTIHFTNSYNRARPDQREQRAIIPDNILAPETLGATHLEAFDAFVLGPLFHNNLPMETLAVIAAVERPILLAAQGFIRYLDGDRIVWKHPERFLNVLPLVNTVLMDEAELAFVSGLPDVAGGVAMLQAHGAKDVVVTAGSKGSTIFPPTETFAIPAFRPVQVVDPTGAGDSYLAGYVFARLRGDDPARAGRFAAMTATASIEETGALRLSATNITERLAKTYQT